MVLRLMKIADKLGTEIFQIHIFNFGKKNAGYWEPVAILYSFDTLHNTCEQLGESSEDGLA